MKLSRLLATLALVAGVLAVPAPAGADGQPFRPSSPETIMTICRILGGSYAEIRLSHVCEISDGTIVCTDRCLLHRTELLDTPPLLEPCEFANGSFHGGLTAQFICELEEGQVSATCPGDPRLASICDLLIVTGSEQPMD